jgi:hypothetical protein
MLPVTHTGQRLLCRPLMAEHLECHVGGQRRNLLKMSAVVRNPNVSHIDDGLHIIRIRISQSSLGRLNFAAVTVL